MCVKAARAANLNGVNLKCFEGLVRIFARCLCRCLSPCRLVAGCCAAPVGMQNKMQIVRLLTYTATYSQKIFQQLIGSEQVDTIAYPPEDTGEEYKRYSLSLSHASLSYLSSSCRLFTS